MKICIDVGGVLTDYEGDDKTRIINVNGAKETLEKWKSENHELIIISFCKERAAFRRSNRLIEDGDSDLFNFEYYVADKMDKKDVINYIENVHIMIDDNEEVLNKIKEANKNVITIMFQEFNNVQKTKHKKHFLANNWNELSDLIDTIKNNNRSIIYDFVKKDLYQLYTIKEISQKAIFIE